MSSPYRETQKIESLTRRFIDPTINKMESIYAGILCISRTYGRTENGKKLLYKCVPDDRNLPHLLVPYQIQTSFNKSHKDKYILFRCADWTKPGEITETIGDVDSAEAFNEYQVCRKQLRISLTTFTNVVKRSMRLETVGDPETKLVEQILRSGYKIDDYTGRHIISIDPDSCTDFDDAFSAHVENEQIIVSTYISNVFLWLEIFGLWDSVTDKVSTIYLPDKKRPMLPSLLSERLCSLQQGVTRFAFVMTIKYDMKTKQQIGDPTFANAQIRVSKNWTYDDPKLGKDKTYKLLRDISGGDSHDVVAWWMIKMNNECAKIMRRGIFRTQERASTTNDFITRWLKLDGGEAAIYSDKSSCHAGLNLDHYLHITSPIRRIADIINQTIFIQDLLGESVSTQASNFIAKWMNKLDYMNEMTRNIRKVQMDCELLALCAKNVMRTDTIYVGKPIAINKPCEYTIYVEELRLITYMKTSAELTLYEDVRFQVFVFNDEARLCRKIRLGLVNDGDISKSK